MRTVFLFTRRSIRLFLRDRATVFFSFLSTIILLGLYFLFIGKSYADGIRAAIGDFLSHDSIYATVYIQMIVGVLVLNSLSLSLGAFSIIARDFESRRVDGFLLTPAKPSQLLAAYFSGGLIVSFVLNSFTWLLSVGIIGLAFGYWASASTILAVIGILIFASVTSCSIMLLMIALVKSSAAIAVFSGVAGTFLGFLCGIYMPYAQLGKGVEKVGSLLPLTHLTIWLKQIVLADAFRQLDIAAEFQDVLLESFSAQEVGLAGLNIPLGGMLLYTAVFALACLFFAGRIAGRRFRG